jgi:hypothetical protein
LSLSVHPSCAIPHEEHTGESLYSAPRNYLGGNRNVSLKHQPRAPRLGELRLGLVQSGTEAMRRQARHHHCASDGPLPGPIVGHAAARLEDAANVAPLGVNHIPVVWAPRPGAALAGVAEEELGSGGLTGIALSDTPCCTGLAFSCSWTVLGHGRNR